MLNSRSAVLGRLAFVAMAAACSVTLLAQATPGVVTVFDHEKLDASFSQALANGGGNALWSHISGQKTYTVQTHSRDSVKAACKPEGCSHTGYVAVVYVVSGAATLLVGGTVKAPAADKAGGKSMQGQSIQGGASRRIRAGDVFIMPPDTVHWYKDVDAPFRYIEVPVP